MVHSDFRTLYDVTGRINDVNTVLHQHGELDKLIKAAQQALETLIWTTGSGDFGPGGIAHEGDEKCLYPAIAALREALEEDTKISFDKAEKSVEQQVDPCVDGSCSCCWAHIDQQPAEQEPAATVQTINGVTIGYLKTRLPDGTKIYTAPLPTRQPLTQEQAWENDEITEVNADVGLVMGDLMRLVRAIERAHGVGGVKHDKT